MKKTQRLASKLRPVKTFKDGKCYFTGKGDTDENSDTDGRAISLYIIIDKYSPFLLSRLLYGR